MLKYLCCWSDTPGSLETLGSKYFIFWQMLKKPSWEFLTVSEIESGSLPSQSLRLHLRAKRSRKAIIIPLWPSWVTAISGHLECLLLLPPDSFEQVLHKPGLQFPLAGNDQQTKAQLYRKIWYSYSKRGDTNQCEGTDNLYQATLPRTLHYTTAWSI